MLAQRNSLITIMFHYGREKYSPINAKGGMMG